MSDSYVLDASAILCLLFDELGAAEVERRRPGAIVSAVNIAEVVSKLVERGASDALARQAIATLNITVVPLNQETAEVAGFLRTATRHAGLSLGDRCCLALAAGTGRIAATTDKAWANVRAGVAIETLR